MAVKSKKTSTPFRPIQSVDEPLGLTDASEMIAAAIIPEDSERTLMTREELTFHARSASVDELLGYYRDCMFSRLSMTYKLGVEAGKLEALQKQKSVRTSEIENQKRVEEKTQEDLSLTSDFVDIVEAELRRRIIG